MEALTKFLESMKLAVTTMFDFTTIVSVLLIMAVFGIGYLFCRHRHNEEDYYKQVLDHASKSDYLKIASKEPTTKEEGFNPPTKK